MKESFKPLLEQIRMKFKNSDEFRETVAKNFAQTRETLETTAKEVVQQTKSSKFVTEYVRPAVESAKTEDALVRLETKITQSGSLVSKLREIRKQFLDATQPALNRKSTRKKKNSKVDSINDAE